MKSQNHCLPKARKSKGSRGDIISRDSYTRLANRIISSSSKCKVARSSSNCRLVKKSSSHCRKLKKKPSRLIHPYNLENKRPSRCPTPKPRAPSYCRRPSRSSSSRQHRSSRSRKRKSTQSPQRRRTPTPSRSPRKRRSGSNCYSQRDSCCPQKDSCYTQKDPCCPQKDPCCPQKDPCCPKKEPSRERRRSCCKERRTSPCRIKSKKSYCRRSCSPNERKQDCFNFCPVKPRLSDFNRDNCCTDMDTFQPSKDFCDPCRNDDIADLCKRRARRRVRDLERQMRPRQSVIVCPCPDACSQNPVKLKPLLCEKDSSHKENKNHSKISRKLWRKPKRIVMKSVISNTSTNVSPVKPSECQTIEKPPLPPRPPRPRCFSSPPSGGPPASSPNQQNSENCISEKRSTAGEELCVKPEFGQKYKFEFCPQLEFNQNSEFCPKLEFNPIPESCPKPDFSSKSEFYSKHKQHEWNQLCNDPCKEKINSRPNNEILKLSNISNFIPNVSPKTQLKVKTQRPGMRPKGGAQTGLEALRDSTRQMLQICPDCHNLLPPPALCSDRLPKSVLFSRKAKTSAYSLDMKVRKRKQKPGTRKIFDYCNCAPSFADARNTLSLTQTKCFSPPLSKSPSPSRNPKSSFQERVEKAIRQYSGSSVNGCFSKSSTRFGSSSTSALSLKNPRQSGVHKVGKASVSAPSRFKDETIKHISTSNVPEKINDLCETIDKLVKNSKSCSDSLDGRSFDFQRNDPSTNPVKKCISLAESRASGCPNFCPIPKSHCGNSYSDPKTHCGSPCPDTKVHCGSPCPETKVRCGNSGPDSKSRCGSTCPEPKVRCGILFRCCHLITGCFVTSNESNICKDGTLSTAFPVKLSGVSTCASKATTASLLSADSPISSSIKSRKSLFKMFIED